MKTMFIPQFTGHSENRCQKRSRAFTIVEVMMAVMVVGIGLGSIFLLTQKIIDVLASARDSATISQILQQRTERLRIDVMKASSVITASSLGALMAEATDSEPELGVGPGRWNGFWETVTLEELGGGGSIIAGRGDTGRPANSGASVTATDALRARINVQWRSRNGKRSLSREYVTVLHGSGLTPRGIRGIDKNPIVPGSPYITPTPAPVANSGSGSDDGDDSGTDDGSDNGGSSGDDQPPVPGNNGKGNGKPDEPNKDTKKNDKDP